LWMVCVSRTRGNGAPPLGNGHHPNRVSPDAVPIAAEAAGAQPNSRREYLRPRNDNGVASTPSGTCFHGIHRMVWTKLLGGRRWPACWPLPGRAAIHGHPQLKAHPLPVQTMRSAKARFRLCHDSSGPRGETACNTAPTIRGLRPGADR